MPDRERKPEKRGRHPAQREQNAHRDPDRALPIGRFVRERRTASRMSQAVLGELAGVGTRFVSELERGKPTLRMDAVNRVLAVFGKTLGLVNAPRKEPGQ